jgi:large conductance mechanosensitive channel
MKTLNEFKAFILRGNVIDLAVGFVIGAAFTAVVTALVKDLITPLIAALGAQPDFSAWYFTVNRSKFMIGDFIDAVVAFLIVATVVFFLIVHPVNRLMGLRKSEPVNRECPYCLSSVPKAATRCPCCTSQLEPAQPASPAAPSTSVRP